ncbi:hypothetical protein RB596_008088 [Gaeumannomyces avenae]
MRPLWLAWASASAASFSETCLSFKPEFAASTLSRLEHIPANTTLQLDSVPSCNRPSQAVQTELCRVALQIATSERSGISFELWLPAQWSGRLLATGNGGVDGCIKYEDLAYGAAHGFAVVGTNNGHNGTTGVEFLNNPDVIEDFAYRALHTGTSAAKSLVEAFYGTAPARSYYIGCSLGGRMGISAAERFPDDYDGIVAGAPAVDFNNLYGSRANFFTITGAPGSPDYIPIDTWTSVIHPEVLRQCDGIDGVVDGIIEVPSKCHFDPSVLLCAGQYGCLSAAQVKQVQQIYAPYTYPDGSLIFPRMNPGMELRAVDGLLAGKPFSPSVEWFRYAVLNNPNWDPATYTVDDVGLAEQLQPSIKTYPQTLPFRGKLLVYHGGQDQQITSFNTERFWDMADLGDARFFRISGMDHCGGGPGAWVLGQGGNAAGVFDPESNVLAAVVRWVENGTAPETITGTKYVADDPSRGIDFQRAHCRYPLEQTYTGSGWECK